ncbi:MAG: TM2 domain-containing protein [Bacteroidales bacterium]|nr:TM2 domain-containing protein [Bacteroidales bacterium]
MKNKTTAALLAFFLGGLGVHRFYLGQPILGIVYLLLCWTLIPAIVGLIDFIVLLSYSDQKFNSKYNKSNQKTRHSEAISNANKDKSNTDDLVNVTNRKVGSNTTEMTIDLNEENLVALFKEKQKQREAEIKNFNYVPMQIQRQGIQLLESINILNTTKSLDTLSGRYEFISNMYHDFVKASHNRRYISDIQVAIDQYKTMYYDRILNDYELQLLVRPDHEKLTDYYSDCLFNCFNGFYEEQKEQIETLKRDDAKQRRKEKIIEIADKTISEFDKNGSDNDRFKPLLNSLRETIDSLDSHESKSQANTTELLNPIVINPKSTFELTLYNANQKEIKKVVRILKDDNVWNKEKDLLPLFATHNIKCKEIEDYILEYKPQYHKFIEQAKANSAEYKTASEMDRLDIENEFKKEAINNLYERAACELDILFEGSEIPETIDDELIKEYGFETTSKYISFSYRKDKIISNWERKEFEDLLKTDLAISGSDLPNEELLFSQTLKTLNKIAEKEEGHFKRKQKAVDYLTENPKLLDNIGKHVSTRSMFKIKPLPEKFKNIDLENLSASWAYVKEYIRLLTDTYRDSERCTEDIKGDKSWIKEFRVEKHEDFVPDFICQRARKECDKKYSKNRPPKLPFHVGCNCNLRTEI